MNAASRPHDGPAAALLRQLSPADAAFLDGAQRPFPQTPRETTSPLRMMSRREAIRSQPSLLINGCGRSGTHALVGLLRRNGVSALHEGHGREATVGWPYVGRLEASWKEYWPMSNQPHGTDVHDPIFKVHRNPLTAIRSIASGLTSSGACRNPSERRWDARAWNCATRFIPLPMVSRGAIDAQLTCKLGSTIRLSLALHYWVKWNLLADRWATQSFAVETVTVDQVMASWCHHCATAKTCKCPAVAAEFLARWELNHSSTGRVGAMGAAPRTALRTGERVRARKGHGSNAKRQRKPLTWAELNLVDTNMTQVAQRLAKEYGYDA